MRIHEIITELDPSRRSFLKTVGKTAVGAAGAAALGNLATGTASAQAVGYRDPNDPVFGNLLVDLQRAGKQFTYALENFQDEPNLQNYKTALAYAHRYYKERDEMKKIAGYYEIETQGKNAPHAICQITSSKYHHFCALVKDNRERIDYLVSRNKERFDSFHSQLNKK